MSAEPCLGNDTLVAVLDGKASSELRARVERHAASCSTCRELLSSLARETTPGDGDGGGGARAVMPERVGRFVVTSELGAGGMGVVYAAHDPELGRTVAVKLLHDRHASADMQERLRREAQAMAQLAHPNVVTVFDVGTFEGRLFVAMEYVEGDTLAVWERGREPAVILDTYVLAGRGLAAAHAAGIVHRDFKPDNVLIGRDGRVRVADFGLARASGSKIALLQSNPGLDVSPDAPTEAPSGSLTQDGALVGTPYYIAPELYEGGEANARSDQYSYCIALSTALKRGRDRIAASRRLRRALERGLAERPDDRFPTMDALLAEIAPATSHRKAMVAAALGASAFAATAALAVTRSHHEPPCVTAGDGIVAVWNAPRRAALAVTIPATGLPYAPTTAREVDRVLDRYAGDWRSMRIGACEATRVRGDQSEELLDRRMACLEERRRAFAQLVDVVAGGKRDAIAHAVAAANELPAIVDCGDASVLADPVRPPNPAIKERVAALAGDLAAVDTRRTAGDYTGALAAAHQLREQAASLAYRPLEARIELAIGRLERATEKFAEARASDERALLAAEAGRDDRTRAQALIELVIVVGHDLAKTDEGEALRAHGDAAVERLDRPPVLQASLLEAAGTMAIDAGKLEDSERDLKAALALVELTYGADDYHVVEPLNRLAFLQLQRMHGAEAEALIQRARKIQERVLGADHPDVGDTVGMLAGAEYEQQHYDEAVALYRRALAIAERSLGKDSVTAANLLSDLGGVYQWQGKPFEAVDVDRQAVEIATQHLGATHPRTLTYRYALASALADVERYADALAELEPVLAAQKARLGDHQDTANTLQMIAHVEVALARFATARDHALEALAMDERVLGPSYKPVDELVVLGRAYLGLGDPARAADTFTKARTIMPTDTDAIEAAWVDAELGRSLYDAGRDRARGLTLVRAAREVLAKDERSPWNVREIDRWLAARGISL
jgi:tetratricopeptide (TPR) repeat protein/predicted Ser/Thr protein kinase